MPVQNHISYEVNRSANSAGREDEQLVMNVVLQSEILCGVNSLII